MIKKLELFGHVHGRPQQIATSYYSSPMGMTNLQVTMLFARFKRAFIIKKLVKTHESGTVETINFSTREGQDG